MLDLSYKEFVNEKVFNEFRSNFMHREEYFKKMIFEMGGANIEYNNDEMIINGKNGEVESINITKDYMIPFIERKYSVNTNIFKKDIADKGIFGDSEVQNYCSRAMNNLMLELNEVENTNHLNKLVKKAIITSIQDTYDFVSSYDQNHREEDKKIDLDLGKNDIITLIHLLIENEVIDQNSNNIKISEIFRVFEKSFRFLDEDHKEYKSIKNGRKLYLEIFGDKAWRSPDKSLDKLRNIFIDNNFYNV